MKRTARKIIVAILGWQVRRLRKKNAITVIAVVGSIGKTSTKFAVARTLSSMKSVRWQEGNYNDLVSVPLVFFGRNMPSLLNPFAWLGILLTNELQIFGSYSYDVVVLELGTDGPGQIEEFGQYVESDITIVTALTPEHMEYFANLDAVAAEELSVAGYSKKLLVNADLCNEAYYKDLKDKVVTYGEKGADIVISKIVFTADNAAFTLKRDKATWLDLEINAVSKGEIYSATAASLVAEQLKLTDAQITDSVRALTPVSGRMQRLKGIHNSLILDETYNASPEAVFAALDSLYVIKAPHKIVLLGNMNELGDFSEDAHIQIGEYCDPKQLDLVVTLGPDANNYTAKSAKAAGCKVKSFDNPYDAGEYIKSVMKPESVILAKGSQNRVFAEEAVKLLLADPGDKSKLVRQSADWMKKKQANFGRTA